MPIFINAKTSEHFNYFDTKDYVLPTLPKIEDTRGYLYIVQDSAYPDYIKIGRTSNLTTRLTSYNSDRPIKSANYICVSRMFTNVPLVEQKIIDYIKINLDPKTARLEWFDISHKDLLIELITEAEEFFD